jgi:hypothetical protein
MIDIVDNFTQDFTVTNGHLLSVGLVGKEGEPISGNIRLEIKPLITNVPPNYFIDLDWNEDLQRYQAVLTPDIYYIYTSYRTVLTTE